MASGSAWDVPEPHSVHDVQHEDGSVTKLRRHGDPRGVRLLVGHGNGLASDFYYPFWSRFTDDFDVFVYDLRNHGWNAVGPKSGHNIPNLIRDQEDVVESLADRFGPRCSVGVFHSLSALTALLSQTLGTGRTGDLSAWIFFDPPLVKPKRWEKEFDKSIYRPAEVARRRTDRFRDTGQFAEVAHHFLLSRAVPGAAELMARTVLRSSPDGNSVELRCPREYEAQIWAYARSFAYLVDLSYLPCPTQVIGSDSTKTLAYRSTLNLGRNHPVDYDFIPDSTHLLQLEHPKRCERLIRRFLRNHGFA
ncbi:MAG: alpha/beta hydrolase [Gammaproteobacteria bacterium]|nr:alpha/beta hydrolase [Gammaproteobacteria bacterium]